MTTPSPACPDCQALLSPGRPARCPSCRLPLVGTDAAALWQLTLALQGLDAHRVMLVQQRERLLEGLRARRDGAVVEPEGTWTAPPQTRVTPGAWGAPPVGGQERELSGPSAQTVLLVLGGLLVTVAALVFTVVNWGQLGIGGRSAVLAALTGCALALPHPLRRRGLSATAETSACIGLALVLMDAYAARAADLAGLGGVNGAGYWAVATALTSVGAGAYGWAWRLRLPLASSFLLGRLPALLAVNAAGLHGADASAGAMIATAAVDYALLANRPLRTALLRGAMDKAVRPGTDGTQRAGTDGTQGTGTDATRGAGTDGTHGTSTDRERGGTDSRAAAMAAVAALWGLAGGAVAALASLTAALSFTFGQHQTPATTTVIPDALATTTWAWPPLGALALLALMVSLRHPELGLGARRLAGGVAGAAVLVTAGGSLALAFPEGWTALAYGAPAALLLALSATLLRRTGRATAPPHGPALAGAFYAAGGTLLAASLALIPDLVRALLEPLGHVHATWASVPAPAWTWTVAPAALTGLWLLAGAVTAIAALRATTVAVQRIPAVTAGTVGTAVSAASLEAVAAVLTVPALALLPVALGLPYGVSVGVPVLVTLAAAAAAAAAASRAARPAVLAGLTVAPALALLWALADRAATITVLGVLAVAAGALTVRRSDTVPPAVTACLAVLTLGAEALAVGATAGLDRADIMLGVLAVAIASAPVAARTRGSVSLSIEVTGYGLGGLALALTADQPGRLAFDLTLAAVAALGVALRADRRRPATLTATALLIIASWIRLALSNVHTPEAYTLPLACAALALGLLQRRRRPETDSWSAYGAGLGLGLLPSLLAVWGDGHWLRPLLVGAAALAVTVLGARRRLQCPLTLGGAALLLVGVHELAPTVVQVLGLLPRWVPLAVVGLLLLALGATYEQRLRDARRLRDSLRRLG